MGRTQTAAAANIKDLAPEADLRILLQGLYEPIATVSIGRTKLETVEPSIAAAGGKASQRRKRKASELDDDQSVVSEDEEGHC